MENKKQVKIRISTLLLVIAIFIIIILCIIICILLNENSLIKSKNAELSNSKNIELHENANESIAENLDKNEEFGNDTTNIENNNSKKITLPQIDGEFYEIEEIIKEERVIENVKNYKDFEFDLDKDGEIDKITLRHIVNENEEENSFDREYYTLEYNGETIYERWYGYGKIGIVDLDESDEFLEVWIYDDGQSDDPCYIFFRKDGKELVELGWFEVDLGFYVDGKGKVLAANRLMPWVEPTVFDSYYTIENNVFKKHNLDFSHNESFEYTSNNCFFTTDLEYLEKLKNDDSQSDDFIKKGEKYNINKLDENTKFKIIEFVKRTNEYETQNLKIELSDGRSGYLIHPYGVFYMYD